MHLPTQRKNENSHPHGGIRSRIWAVLTLITTKHHHSRAAQFLVWPVNQRTGSIPLSTGSASQERAYPTGHHQSHPFLYDHCYGQNVCVPPKFRRGNLLPSVTISGGGAFGTWLGRESGVLENSSSALIHETPESSLSPSTGGDTARKWPSVNQEAGSHQPPNLPAPWCWTSSLQNCEK